MKRISPNARALNPVRRSGHFIDLRPASPARSAVLEKRLTWIILVVAGLLEVVWAIGLKYTEGFTRIVPSAVTIVAMIGSVWLLALAVKSLPLGTAYAVWVGIGTVGAFIAGIVLFGESAGVLRLASAALIVAGLVGLKLSS
jgi:quaternary ammonium compound-resistance protein SugE